MTKVLFSGNIDIFYGQFYIDVLDSEDDDYLDMESAFEKQNNGLCGACHKGKLFFVVGPQDGAAKVTVELHESEPNLIDSFDDIVECSFLANTNDLHLCEWAHEATHNLNLPSGEYIVRYSAKKIDMDYGEDDDWETPIEGQEYIIQFWPGKLPSDKILQTNTTVGQYWHKEMGSQ